MQQAELALRLNEAAPAEAKKRQGKPGKARGRGKQPPTLAKPKTETRDELTQGEKIVAEAAPVVVEAARTGDAENAAATPGKEASMQPNEQTPNTPAPLDENLRFICRRCGHKWYPRTGTTPTTCPACRSPNWREETTVIHCYKCNHTWATRGATPDALPQRCAGCNALLTRRAVWYNTSLKAYRRTAAYKKLAATFRQARKMKKRRRP